MSNRRKAVIMAGGEGVRLRPYTFILPKPLLPVGDTTVLDHIIDCLRTTGFSEVYVSVNYKSREFEDWLESRKADGITVTLYKEPRKLGTAGSLGLIREQLNQPFCVVNGDLIMNVPLDKMYERHLQTRADITIGIKGYQFTIPYAVVNKDKDGMLESIVEKPSYDYFINAGIYILSQSVFQHIPQGEPLDMPSLIDALKRAGGRICVYDIGQRWLDIGRISDYEKAVELINQWKA
ncbi:MAG: NTP transferase domain-containing protein [Candidatus Magnetominusculus sp. LBB02]|nr:NTP transferase domain-containing protein [Candidatus Magnetominusculus sp. LBB02]